VEITIWDLDDCHKGTGGPKCPEGSVGNGGGDSEQDGEGSGGGGDDNGDGEGSDEGNGDGEDEDDEDDASNVPLVACDFENYDADSTSLTTVSWYYWVESSAEDNSNVADKVCGAMSTAVIGSFDNKCATRRRKLRRLNHQNRQLEIQGYSQEVTCEYVADCVPTNEASGSCGVYEGTIQIAYDDEGENSSASEVSETVHAVAEDTLSGDGAAGVEATVADSLDDSDTGDQLIDFGYGNPNDEKEKDVGTAGLSGEVFRDTSSQGLSRAGKAAIAAMSALVLLLLLLCCICWRRRRNGNGGKGGSSDGSLGTDATLASSPGRRGFLGGGASKGSLSDDDTYLTSDYNNLGLHHSKLDVHQCQSASCLQCSPIVRDNENGVFFVNSKGNSPLSDIVEEEMMSGYISSSEGGRLSPSNYIHDDDDQEDSIGGSEVPPPPPAHAPPSVNGNEEPAAANKSFFSKFRRSKKSSITQEQPVVIAEGSRDGLGDVEVEI
jgi:hypothetical protein